MTSSPRNSTGYVIKKCREKRFPGQGGIKKCAESFGVNYQQWRNWESGHRKPGVDYLQKLAEFFDITIEELQGEVIIPAVTDPSERILAGIKYDVYLPVFGSAAAATGGQDEFHDDDGYETFLIPAGTGMVDVNGSSMEPLARHGQKVFLRPALPPGEEPNNGDLVIVWTRSIGTSKRYFKRWGGWIPKRAGRASADDQLVLISVNPIDAVNIMEHVRRDELEGFRVVAGVWYG